MDKVLGGENDLVLCAHHKHHSKTQLRRKSKFNKQHEENPCKWQEEAVHVKFLS